MITLSSRGLVLGAAGALVGLCMQLTGAGVAAASAATVSNTEVAGTQEVVSCLTPKLCVIAGYNKHGVGDVVPVRDGKPGHAVTIRGTSSIESVSCPTAAGCLAIADAKSGVGLTLVTINKHGVPSRHFRVKVPAGVSLARITCTKLTACVLAGNNPLKTPVLIEVASWNGRKLVLHHRDGLPHSTTDNLLGLSCHGASCLAVGIADVGTASDGIVVRIHHGKPSTVTRVKNDPLYGAACPSASKCYADGIGRHGGTILGLTNGAIKRTQSTAASLADIACHGGSCTAVGEELPPPSAPLTQGYEGVVISLSGGTITASQTISKSGGFNSVAQPGPTVFVAVGASGSVKLPSEVSTG
jgi:hypothetical protein